MALGKPYTLRPAPNYQLCRDEGDTSQLTDGEIYAGNGQPWTQKGTVGWKGIATEINSVMITVDLGKVEPIGGIGFHSGFDGPESVQWPSSIAVFAGEDGTNYAFIAELVDPVWKDDGLPPEVISGKNTVYWYRKQGLRAKGRFVVFVAQAPHFLFCDEMEILRGEDKARESGKTIRDLGDYIFFKGLFFRDIQGIRRRAMSLDDEARRTIEEKISAFEIKLADADMALFRTSGCRAVAPLNDLQRDLFRINAEVLRLKGAPPLVIWRKHRWDPLDATEVPESAIPGTCWERFFSCLGFFDNKLPALELTLMDNEYRAEVLNLTNAGQEDREVTVFFEGLPGGKTPAYIRVHQVEYTATKQGKMIADALPEAEKDKKGHKIRIPAGMTRQVWFTVHPEGIKTGSYQGAIVLVPKGLMQRKVKFNLAVAPFKFSDRPRLSFAVWDYTDKPYGFKCMTDANVAAAIADMKAHFVDTPFGHAQSACYPAQNAFDAQGKLTGVLQTKGFDEWVSKWKDARHYGLYLGNTLSDFVVDEPLGSELFNRKIAQWAAAFAAHAENKGIPPESIILLLSDEPDNIERFKFNALWAKAIKQGCPRFRLFADPIIRDERSVSVFAEMFEAHDIICAYLPFYRKITDVLRNPAKSGIGPDKEFWLYNSPASDNPTRLLDPYYYHLLQSWHCWKNGAVGMGTWNYWNNTSAWNEVEFKGDSYGLVYTTEDSVVSGKHWEALREGIEDYEYLGMLGDRIEGLKKNGKKSEALQEAEAFLREAPEQVADKYDCAKFFWSADKDRTAADTARREILRLLERTR